MIMSCIELVPSPGSRKAVLEILLFVGEHVRRKPDCLDCGVFEAANETPQVLYVEQWQSNKGLQAHIQSSLYLRLLNAMELASEQPKISFHEIAQTRSIELIEEWRGVRKLQ
jgi:quinol monooxygenase YgiN